ncbi:MAG: PilZ domain-containing protein, partial [Nitrospira sp.]
MLTRMLSATNARACFQYFHDTKSGDGNKIMSHINKFVIRTYHRIPVRCVVYYLGGDFLGKGTVINLCRNGFRVLGDHQVAPGMELVVRLTLPDKDEP